MAAQTDHWRQKLESVLLAEVSSRSLGLLRIFVGFLIYVEHASPWVAHRMDSQIGTWLLAWGVLASVWFVIFGFKTRAAAIVMALCYGGMHLYYGVHLEMAQFAEPVRNFQLCVLLAVTPCGRSLSVDRVLAVRRAQAEGRAPPPERAPWWTLELFVLQLASTFLWIGYDHLDPHWLDASMIEQHFITLYAMSDMFVAHPWFHAGWVAFAWITVILEFTFAFGLLWRRSRPWVAWLMVAYLFVHLPLFSRDYLSSYQFLMPMLMLIACFDPKWIHALTSYQAPQPAKSSP